MSILRYATGRGRFVGQSLIYPVPIPLDAAQYFGAAVVGENGQFYYSNGLEWIVPIEDNEILRPSALVPFSVDERTQLRLTTFRSPAGLEQTGIIFEISSNGVDFDGALTRIIPGFGNAYQLEFPEDGFGPGDRVLWRAAYTGTSGAQSNFSVPYAQTFPELISRPTPITRENAISGAVRITDFESASLFGYGYGETQTAFYAPDATPGVDAPLITVTQTGGAITTVPIPPLEPAANYLWRSRYGGRLNTTAPMIYSAWSSPRSFFLGAASLILTYDLALATARTIYVPLGGGTINNPLDVIIDWGDGSSERFTTDGIKPHTYAEGPGSRVTVTITGRLDWYGTTQPIDQAGLIRVENIGFAMGLTSLRGAFRQTTMALDYITPNIPETVTSFEELFRESGCTADLRDMDTRNITSLRQIFRSSIGTGPNCANWDVGQVTDVFQAFYFAQMNSPFSKGNWISLTSMQRMFFDNAGFNQPIGYWDVSGVTNMSEMFGREAMTNGLASTFDQDISDWDVRSVTDMSFMFGQRAFAGTSGSVIFNNGGSGNINNWNVSSVTTMRGMFGSARDGSRILFNQPIGSWDTGNATDMALMFSGASRFNRPIGNWNVSRVTDMSNMFELPPGLNATGHFNQNIGNWDVSSVANMEAMFANLYEFNNGGSASINTWDVSSVTNMRAMFSAARSFNQPIGSWDVARVSDMRSMFMAQTAGPLGPMLFNQDITGWDVSSVTTMDNMFGGAGELLLNSPKLFNQPIGSWDVSNVASMRFMFGRQSVNQDLRLDQAFDQDLSGWSLRPGGVDMTGFMALVRTPWSQENYSRTLTGWSNKAADNSGPLSANPTFFGSEYNTTAYRPGARFASAPPARAFLTSPRSLSVTGATAPEADGLYPFDAAAGVYLNADGWYFLKTGTDWILYDPDDTQQATGTGTGPWDAPTWTGALAAATVLINGAAWTIAGDTPA
tara:strand:- start:36242 stop:39115 length:2874 start_codon:yes stop_codon:yes gene_type:complete